MTEAVAALKDKGIKATGASVDIMDGAALKTWIAKAGDELGGIDILVSNAGAMAQGGDPASWEQNFKLDVLGAVNAFDAARPFLETAAQKNKDAAFIIIASVSAAESDSGSSYGPIKAALIHYAKGLARQYAKINVRTNVVSPGMVYFEGGVVGDGREEHARFLQAGPRAQPHRALRHTAGHRQRRRVPRQPRLVLHDRCQPAGGRHDQPAGEFLGTRGTSENAGAVSPLRRFLVGMAKPFTRRLSGRHACRRCGRRSLWSARNAGPSSARH